MDERNIHPDIVKAAVRGEVIGGEVIPKNVEDLYQWYLDTFKDMPEIMSILRESEEEVRETMRKTFASFASMDPEALLRK